MALGAAVAFTLLGTSLAIALHSRVPTLPGPRLLCPSRQGSREVGGHGDQKARAYMHQGSLKGDCSRWVALGPPLGGVPWVAEGARKGPGDRHGTHRGLLVAKALRPAHPGSRSAPLPPPPCLSFSIWVT